MQYVTYKGKENRIGQGYHNFEKYDFAEIYLYDQTMVFCSDLLWEKIVLVIEKNFWNSRLKAENLQKFWDLIIQTVKGQNKFW